MPLVWPMPPLGGPLLCAGSPEDPRWGKTAVWRQSTGALRAWLAQHLQSPYPSKGEKVLLAVLSRRSLSQVSTWFANARRRLKKENRLLTASGEEEAEGKKGQAGGQRADPGRSPQASGGGSRAADPRPGSRQDPDPLASIDQAAPEGLPPGPRLWSVAEPATGLLPGKPRQPRPPSCSLRENLSCAPREGRGAGPAPGSELWGLPEGPSGAERGIARPAPGRCALEVDGSPQEAQLACQLLMQTGGSAHLECPRLGKARAGRGERAAGALLQVGPEGSSRTGRTARQNNPPGPWGPLE